MGCVLLSACNALAPAATRNSAPPKTAAKASARPSLGPSKAPGTTPKASPTPQGPMTALVGSVQVDAHYLLSNKAGSLISNNGSSAIALKGGTLISDNGLGIVSNNAGGIISDNGLGLISDNGLGLISNNSGSYRVFAADAVAVGTILPVKGMVVLPISMRTGAIVGKPVLTDDKGGYTLQVPESVAGTLRIVTRIPVAKADDPIAKDDRAQYNLLVDAGRPPAEQASAIDEDTSVGTRYLRAAFATRLKELIIADDADEAAGELVKALGFDASLKTFLSGTVVELNKASKDAGVPKMAPEAIDALSQRLTDLLLSYVPVYTIEIDPVKYGKTGPKEPAFAGMADVIKQVRLAATASMAANPQAFEHAGWMADAEYPRVIKKPTDVCDFIVDNYLVSLHGARLGTFFAFNSAGVPDAEFQSKRINALAIGLLANVGQTLLSQPEAKDRMLAAIKASAKK